MCVQTHNLIFLEDLERCTFWYAPQYFFIQFLKYIFHVQARVQLLYNKMKIYQGAYQKVHRSKSSRYIRCASEHTLYCFISANHESWQLFSSPQILRLRPIWVVGVYFNVILLHIYFPKIHVMCILSCSNIIKLIHISPNVISVPLKEDLSDKCGLNVVVLPAMFLTTTHMGSIWGPYGSLSQNKFDEN